MFRSAMLIAEMDFEGVDRLAIAHEAEVSGFDHACVNRADAHLVNLLARKLVERIIVLPSKILTFKADRLEPRVVDNAQPVLFVNLPFKTVHCGKLAGEGVVFLESLTTPSEMS